MGIVGRDRHLYLFRPALKHGSYSAWGFHHRRRLRDGSWGHVILRLAARGATVEAGQRGTLTWELQTYRTRFASSSRPGNRLTFKRYFRVKVGKGGTKHPTPVTVGEEGELPLVIAPGDLI